MKRSRVKPRSKKADAYAEELGAMRPLVAQRSQGRCEAEISVKCRRVAVHVHHRKLRSHGGDNALENLLHVCMPCHEYGHSHPSLAREAGFLVPSWLNPATVTVQKGFRGA